MNLKTLLLALFALVIATGCQDRNPRLADAEEEVTADEVLDDPNEDEDSEPDYDQSVHSKALEPSTD